MIYFAYTLTISQYLASRFMSIGQFYKLVFQATGAWILGEIRFNLWMLVIKQELNATYDDCRCYTESPYGMRFNICCLPYVSFRSFYALITQRTDIAATTRFAGHLKIFFKPGSNATATAVLLHTVDSFTLELLSALQRSYTGVSALQTSIYRDWFHRGTPRIVAI